MKKISGIKSVDFKIEANGFGVINWNGNASLYSEQAKKFVENHTLPKLRNVDIFKVKKMEDIDSNAKLYISQNCVRQAIFKDFTYGLKEVTLANVQDVLQSLVGLVRGYVIAEGSTSLKRKSALFLEDFVATDDVKLNYEQFSNSTGRNETSIFSKHTTGKTAYTAYGSINIEDLEFLPLEDSLSRSCYREVITIKEGEELAQQITTFLKTLDFNNCKNPQAIFSNNYTRINSICKTGEAGILLNNDAISLIVKEIIDIIKTLSIKRSRAHVEVSKLIIDYNDGNTMRIKDDESLTNEIETTYAVYYESQPFSANEYEENLKKAHIAAMTKKKEKEKQLAEAEKRKKAKTKESDSEIITAE